MTSIPVPGVVPLAPLGRVRSAVRRRAGRLRVELLVIALLLPLIVSLLSDVG
jgi:hypothetical protein